MRPGDEARRTPAVPLDVSRMGGPQHAEQEGAALTDAAERTTAPKPTPPDFEEVG